MANDVLELRCFEPNDEPECRNMFRKGMLDVLPSLCAIEIKGYMKYAAFLLPLVAVITRSILYSMAFLIVCAIIAAVVYIIVYLTLMDYINEGLNDDLKDIGKFYQDGSCMFVAVLQGKVVGMAGVIHKEQHKPGEAEIMRMSVSSLIRKRGIATKLLKVIEQFRKENDYRRLTLTTTSGQYAAMALYQKHGFRETKRFIPWPLIRYIQLVGFEKEIDL